MEQESISLVNPLTSEQGTPVQGEKENLSLDKTNSILEVEQTRSNDKISSDINLMNNSLYTINCIINGEKTEVIKDSAVISDGVTIIPEKVVQEAKLKISNDSTDNEKKERVNKNVSFLEAMLSLTDWKGSEDWTNVNKAITDGKAYVG